VEYPTFSATADLKVTSPADISRQLLVQGANLVLLGDIYSRIIAFFFLPDAGHGGRSERSGLVDKSDYRVI